MLSPHRKDTEKQKRLRRACRCGKHRETVDAPVWQTGIQLSFHCLLDHLSFFSPAHQPIVFTPQQRRLQRDNFCSQRHFLHDFPCAEHSATTGFFLVFLPYHTSTNPDSVFFYNGCIISSMKYLQQIPLSGDSPVRVCLCWNYVQLLQSMSKEFSCCDAMLCCTVYTNQRDLVCRISATPDI